MENDEKDHKFKTTSFISLTVGGKDHSSAGCQFNKIGFDKKSLNYVVIFM